MQTCEVVSSWDFGGSGFDGMSWLFQVLTGKLKVSNCVRCISSYHTSFVSQVVALLRVIVRELNCCTPHHLLKTKNSFRRRRWTFLMRLRSLHYSSFLSWALLPHRCLFFPFHRDLYNIPFPSTACLITIVVKKHLSTGRIIPLYHVEHFELLIFEVWGSQATKLS